MKMHTVLNASAKQLIIITVRILWISDRTHRDNAQSGNEDLCKQILHVIATCSRMHLSYRSKPGIDLNLGSI